MEPHPSQNIDPLKYNDNRRHPQPVRMERVAGIAMKKKGYGMPQAAARAPGNA